MKTISLCMIVKNEEKYIEKCLNSVASIVDEMILVDTGCTDQTLALAEKFHPKVYAYEWDDHFGNARNESLKHATGDWILVLDADESIHEQDLALLKQLVQTTKADGLTLMFHNFTEEDNDQYFITHTGLRLFQNGKFTYRGAIHEQLVVTHQDTPPIYEPTNLRVLHYGYLKSVAAEKNKRGRNVPIIQKLLDENPHDSFQLFNMGNEYMSQSDFQQALAYFELAYQYKQISQAYAPHLLYRRAACMHYLKRNEEALEALAEALIYYPACTDMEYLRGMIYKLLKRYTLAVDSFEKCVSMGVPPQNLIFVSDTATLRPLLELASIYTIQQDWRRALDYYVRALQVNGKRYDLIYRIGLLLNKIHTDKALVCQNLEQLFANAYHPTNLLVMVDVLLNEKLYEQAKTYLPHIPASGEHGNDRNYLAARLQYYQKDYEGAYQAFLQLAEQPAPWGILPAARIKSFEYLMLCSLICAKPLVVCETALKALEGSEEQLVLLGCLGVSQQPLSPASRAQICRILSELLKVVELDLFEQVLSVLNLVDSNEVLLDLASVYYDHGLKDMAIKTVLRSVKELDAINAQGIYLLNQAYVW